jgi:hypothetical protein
MDIMGNIIIVAMTMVGVIAYCSLFMKILI